MTTNVLVFPAAPAATVPSVSASAMLVDLSISVWEARKLDKQASAEINEAKGAKKDVGRVRKSLLAGCVELDAIAKFRGKIRTAHYDATMPWSDSGLRLLPTAAYFKYHEHMTRMRGEFFALVSTFCEAYEWEISKVMVDMGDFFKRDEYPTVEAVRSKFRMNIGYIPLPESGDWRVDIDKESKQALAEHYNGFYQSALERAMGDVWQRAHKALSNMSERLDYVGDADKKIFRDTLVDNVVEIVDLLEVCNITNDPAMKSARDKLWNAVRGVSADDLRQNHALRRDTKRDVDALIAQLPGLGM